LSRYRHIFFDLDRTLWDFDTNSKEALSEIYTDFQLEREGVIDAVSFINVYTGINEQLWKAYRLGNIHKALLRSLRFSKTLEHFGCRNNELGVSLGNRYVELSPMKTALMPHTLEVLDHLAGRYKLHIITNGFDEVQGIKLRQSGIAGFFQEVITSEMASARKPDPMVFKLAFAKTGSAAATSVMIGDDLDTDISGARGVGMDQVYFNPARKVHNEDVTFEIENLSELKLIL